MWQNPQETVNLVTFTEEILNGKLHFLWSDKISDYGVAERQNKEDMRTRRVHKLTNLFIRNAFCYSSQWEGSCFRLSW